jgi:hypothetical protein
MFISASWAKDADLFKEYADQSASLLVEGSLPRARLALAEPTSEEELHPRVDEFRAVKRDVKSPTAKPGVAELVDTLFEPRRPSQCLLNRWKFPQLVFAT